MQINHPWRLEGRFLATIRLRACRLPTHREGVRRRPPYRQRTRRCAFPPLPKRSGRNFRKALCILPLPPLSKDPEENTIIERSGRNFRDLAEHSQTYNLSAAMLLTRRDLAPPVAQRHGRRNTPSLPTVVPTDVQLPAHPRPFSRRTI